MISISYFCFRFCWFVWRSRVFPLAVKASRNNRERATEVHATSAAGHVLIGHLIAGLRTPHLVRSARGAAVRTAGEGKRGKKGEGQCSQRKVQFHSMSFCFELSVFANGGVPFTMGVSRRPDMSVARLVGKAVHFCSPETLQSLGRGRIRRATAGIRPEPGR